MEHHVADSIEFRFAPNGCLSDICVQGMNQGDLALVHTVLNESCGFPVFFLNQSRRQSQKFHFAPNKELILKVSTHGALANNLASLSNNTCFCKDERAYVLREIFNKLLSDLRRDEKRIAGYRDDHYSLMQVKQVSDEMERGEIESSRQLSGQISSRVVSMLKKENKRRTAILECFKEEGWCGHCNGRDCGEKISADYITSKLTLLCPDCLEEAMPTS